MDNEILKHPDCPFDVIVRDDNALIRYKKTQSLEPANPQIVLTALLIKELTKKDEPVLVVEPIETAPVTTNKTLK